MQVPTTNDTDVYLRYQQVRSQTEALCNPLQPEDYVVQPVVDVSPPKWHLAHTTWFFETFLLKKFHPGYQEFSPDYNYLFNSYYENAGKRVMRTDRGNLTRPGVAEIYSYRQYVDREMDHFLNGHHAIDEEVYRILEIGLQHEQQHQELLITDIKYILGHNPLLPSYLEKEMPATPEPKAASLLEVPEGLYDIGHVGTEFCFDNELEVHKVFLPAFKIADRLVTNAEYLEFVDAGGYQDFNYWLMEGWEWLNVQKIKAPLYWHRIDGQWKFFTTHGLRPLDLNAPVSHVSFYEADAYAGWRGMRLPTEFEWETACKMYQPVVPVAAHFQEQGLFAPVSAGDENYQFYGDCWEWTGSPYRPYLNFKKEEGALGEYNGKFMINQMVLRGGSCASPANHIRSTYRNFFHPHLRWQFTGIRLATNKI